MTNETKHTPTPWAVGSKNTVGVVSQEDDQSFGMTIPFIDVYGDNPSANAAHIVKCVNMHEELVEALLLMKQWCEDEVGAELPCSSIDETLKKAGAL